MAFFQQSGKDTTSFRGQTLLLPSVSVGNVPQLSVDLIVNTLKLSRIGWLNDDGLLPVIGNDAMDYTRPIGYLHTGAEVYSSTDHQLTIIQLRSPVSKGSVRGFCKRLLDWCEGAGFSRVVVLSSSHSHERSDDQLTGSQLRFLGNSASNVVCEQLSTSYNWKRMERRNEEEEPVLLRDSVLSGSGFTRPLYKLSNEYKFPLVVLNMFCSQGDNEHDAVGMATHVNTWLELVEVKDNRQSVEFGVWISPQSWSAVYGGPHPRTLY